MGAILSSCGTYRYELDRDIEHLTPPEVPKVYAYFGVNPSTADAELNDQTIQKLMMFTKLHGGTKMIVGNVFAGRSPDVKVLRWMNDPHGPDNAQHITKIIAAADVLVPMWGSRLKLPAGLRPAFDDLMRNLLGSGKPVQTFGLTMYGDPKHPLFLPYTTSLTAHPGL